MFSLGASYDNSLGENPKVHVTHNIWDTCSRRLLPWVFDNEDNKPEQTQAQKMAALWMKKHGHKEKYKKRK